MSTFLEICRNVKICNTCSNETMLAKLSLYSSNLIQYDKGLMEGVTLPWIFQKKPFNSPHRTPQRSSMLVFRDLHGGRWWKSYGHGVSVS